MNLADLANLALPDTGSRPSWVAQEALWAECSAGPEALLQKARPLSPLADFAGPARKLKLMFSLPRLQGRFYYGSQNLPARLKFEFEIRA